jgi:hypothetical protein
MLAKGSPLLSIPQARQDAGEELIGHIVNENAGANCETTSDQRRRLEKCCQ